MRRGLDPDGLPDETVVVYVSPLKALSNDIRLNLEAPLAGIREELGRLHLPDVDIRTAVRTGDTPQRERLLTRRHPPHILVTTPESLYVLLGSQTGRAHAAHGAQRHRRRDPCGRGQQARQPSVPVAGTPEALAQSAHGRPLVRIGLSATQKPIDEIARFLVGTAAVQDGKADCEIVDIGYARGATWPWWCRRRRSAP